MGEIPAVVDAKRPSWQPMTSQNAMPWGRMVDVAGQVGHCVCQQPLEPAESPSGPHQLPVGPAKFGAAQRSQLDVSCTEKHNPVIICTYTFHMTHMLAGAFGYSEIFWSPQCMPPWIHEPSWYSLHLRARCYMYAKSPKGLSTQLLRKGYKSETPRKKSPANPPKAV